MENGKYIKVWKKNPRVITYEMPKSRNMSLILTVVTLVMLTKTINVLELESWMDLKSTPVLGRHEASWPSSMARRSSGGTN